jgi:hypothetical protein
MASSPSVIEIKVTPKSLSNADLSRPLLSAGYECFKMFMRMTMINMGFLSVSEYC